MVVNTEVNELSRSKEEKLLSIYREVVESGGSDPRTVEVPECVYRSVDADRVLCSDDLLLSENAIDLLKTRYILRDDTGKAVETPSMVFRRVARGLSNASGGAIDEEKIYRLMIEGKIMFNSPTLFNLTPNGALGTLSACYVTPVHDDMRSIMDAVNVQAFTFKWGGGQGFSFSELRPRNDVVASTSGVASGPISFMRLYDAVTDVIKQGGKRRGANMGIMHVWHPDIYREDFSPYGALYRYLPPIIQRVIHEFFKVINTSEDARDNVDPKIIELVERMIMDRHSQHTVDDAGFIQIKRYPLSDVFLTNFNISVAINDLFMKALFHDDDWGLVNPRKIGYKIHYTVSKSYMPPDLYKIHREYSNMLEDILKEAEEVGAIERHVSARKIWSELINSAWSSGDPGVFYVDNHNIYNPTPWLGPVTATNPCAEEPLYPFENCNLASINVSKFVDRNGRFRIDEFIDTVAIVVDALDTIIDINNHPDERQERVNKLTRKIGVGIMGLADALIEMGIPYDSDRALAFTYLVTYILELASWWRSWVLGSLRGYAPAFRCRRIDFDRGECVEESDKLLVDMHLPAILKTRYVLWRKSGDSYVRVMYKSLFHVSLNRFVYSIIGRYRDRVDEDGSIRLFRVSDLEAVLSLVHISGRDSSYSKIIDVALRNILEPYRAYQEIVDLAKREYGSEAPRNTVTTTIAPTGSISILADCSTGIEPIFALVYTRNTTAGVFREVKGDLDRLRNRLGSRLFNTLLDYIAMFRGSLRQAISRVERDRMLREYIEDIREMARTHPTALDVSPIYHLLHQITAQIFIDQGISKTINLPQNAKPRDVEAIYFIAWLGGCKGVTIYRDGSKSSQVIEFGGKCEGCSI